MPLTEDELRVLRAAMGESDDLDHVNAVLAEVSERRKTTPLDDFAGLSPDEMTYFLYMPFDSPEYIQLPQVLQVEPEAPILELLMPLFEELASAPIKLTAKGNLPTRIVKERAAVYRPQHDSHPELSADFAHKEDSFPDLHRVRTVAELAGLLRKQHGKLFLTNKAEKLLREHGARGIYPVLLRTYLGKFNWAYMDRFDELPLIQQSWAFTCYLLQHFGPAERPLSFYVERFLRAFPMLIEEVEPSYMTAEEAVGYAYRNRALVRFLGLFGLAQHSWEKVPMAMPIGSVKPTALMMEAVQLQVR
jgi:hypothetical protein